jgi:DNA-binding CsgD family transcriptional regulator
MSHLGIALDLNVGEETVKTYKNRAYQKLGIGSQRELLMWYLSLWNPFDH